MSFISFQKFIFPMHSVPIAPLIHKCQTIWKILRRTTGWSNWTWLRKLMPFDRSLGIFNMISLTSIWNTVLQFPGLNPVGPPCTVQFCFCKNFRGGLRAFPLRYRALSATELLPETETTPRTATATRSPVRTASWPSTWRPRRATSRTARSRRRRCARR